MIVDHSAFTLDRKELQSVMKMFTRIMGKSFEPAICKIRVMPGGVEFSTAGIFRCINCNTIGLYEILVPIKLIYAYTSHGHYAKMDFMFKEGEMRCGISVFSSPYIKLRNWQQSSFDKLPVNYSDLDIIKLAFTEGEEYLEDHHFKDAYKLATDRLEKAIEEAANSLEYYGISKADIRNMVYDKYRTLMK